MSRVNQYAFEEHQLIMRELYKSGEGADLVLARGNVEFKVHSFLLKQFSGSLAAICKTESKEGGTRRVELAEDDIEDVQRMIQHCYTMDYCDDKPQLLANHEVDPLHNSTPLINAQMFTLAVKYELSGLKATAVEKFKAKLDKYFKGKEDFMDGQADLRLLMALVVFVYNCTPRKESALHDAINDWVLYFWPHMATIPETATLIRENPEFIIDVMNKGQSSKTLGTQRNPIIPTEQ